MDRFFSFLFPGAMFTFPWIQQVLDLSIPMHNIMKHIRESKKFSKYECEISQDPRDLRFFHDAMYTQFVRERFGDQAVVPELERIRFLFPGTEVLFVTESGQRVGGSIGMPDGDTYRWLYTAIIDDRYRKKGALSAAYYFGILRAKETGARSIDLGLSRPFLSDGVALYKRKWRATMKLENQTRRWFLLSNIEKEHLIVLIDGSLTALVTSWDDPYIKLYRDSQIAFKIIPPAEESARTLPKDT
ncbi:MAG: GNAT family N-acetyltransferase [Methanomicrobiaceae archaeon]|nr:GNAT family N-acetyltransferase [Methanomicrobiaceae archaeon]